MIRALGNALIVFGWEKFIPICFFIPKNCIYYSLKKLYFLAIAKKYSIIENVKLLFLNNIMKNKNPKDISKMVLKGLMLSGAVVVASGSPYFASKILPALIKQTSYKLNRKKDKKKIYDTFYRLKKEGMIKFEEMGKQIYISLTKEGKKKAGKYQIDNLEIKKPKKWDKIWRILIFDIKDKQKIKREALRGKIKQLGLYQLQKSVWVCPYNFQKEAVILRYFFGLTNDEMKIITASDIEDDKNIKIFFRLN